MGMSVKEWKTVAEGAVELLGDNWRLVGKGRRLFLVPAPVGWWYQYVHYVNTSAGQLAACTQFLGQQLRRTPYGDHGDDAYHIHMVDHETEPLKVTVTETGQVRFNTINPSSTASWTSAVYEKVFAPYRGSAVADKWVAELAKCERDMQRWVARPDPDAPIDEPYVVRYAVIQAMCGSKTRDELVAALDWSITHVRPESSDWRLSDRNPIEYLQAIRDTVAAGDRAGFEQVVLANRREELLAVGVPEDLIGPVEFPEPLTAWWEK